MTSPSSVSRERASLAIAIVIVIVYAVFRLDATPLWLDEGYTLGAVNRLGDSLRGTYGTMGLYYSVMWAWGLVSTATWWLRIPSVVFAIATLFVMRPVARRIGGSDLVVLALPITALGPMFLWKATEARAYSLETLVVCATWYVFMQAIDALAADDDRAARRWFVAIIPLALAGIFSHAVFLVQLAPMAAVALLGPKPRRAVLWLVPSALVAGLVVLVLRESGAGNIGVNIFGGANVLIGSTIDAFLSTNTLLRLLLTLLLGAGLVVAYLAVRGAKDRTGRAFAAIPAAWAIVPCLALGLIRNFEPVFNTRYLAPIGPGLAMLLAAPLVAADKRFVRWLRGRTDRRLPPVGIAAATGIAVLVAALAVHPPFEEQDWREAARIVATEGKPGDALIFPNLSRDEPVQNRVPFEAAWREVPHGSSPDVISPRRPLGEVRRFDELLTPDEMVDAAMAYDRIWLILVTTKLRTNHDLIADELLANGFVEAERWSVPAEIELLLLERG